MTNKNVKLKTIFKPFFLSLYKKLIFKTLIKSTSNLEQIKFIYSINRIKINDLNYQYEQIKKKIHRFSKKTKEICEVIDYLFNEIINIDSYVLLINNIFSIQDLINKLKNEVEKE